MKICVLHHKKLSRTNFLFLKTGGVPSDAGNTANGAPAAAASVGVRSTLIGGVGGAAAGVRDDGASGGGVTADSGAPAGDNGAVCTDMTHNSGDGAGGDAIDSRSGGTSAEGVQSGCEQTQPKGCSKKEVINDCKSCSVIF